MVVLDWGLAPALVARLADVMRYSQNGIRIAVLAPCWSNLEVGAHRVAGFLVNKPLRVNQIRRVLALASGPRPWAADHAPQIPAGAA